MGLIGHKTKDFLFCAFLCMIWLAIPAGTCPAAEAVSEDTPGDPNAIETPVDPNATDDNDDSEDVFMPKISTLVKINEAYESIFSSDFVTDDGKVRYAELRRKRSVLLNAAKELDNLNPAILMSLSPQEKTAFWINAYNCCILNLIIDHYPIEPKLYMIFYPNNSIMQITGDWRSKHFFDIQTMQYNLLEIEQKFLMQRTQDPRILFALSYASMGGALLRSEPYRAETLDDQLDNQVRRYLQTSQGMQIDKSRNKLYLSNLFTMYNHKELFLDSEYAKIPRFRKYKPAEQAWLNFIRAYVSEDDVKYLESEDFKIEFMKYDWLLNEAH